MPSNQAAGVYVHGEAVTASPVHGGLVPVHGSNGPPIHGDDNNENLGPEIVGDVGFDDAAYWTGDDGVVWTITGGKAVAAASSAFLYRASASIVNGETYRIQFTVSNYAGGTLQAYVGNAGTARTLAIAANGSVNETVTANSASEFGLLPAGFTGQVDSFSIKKVL